MGLKSKKKKKIISYVLLFRYVLNYLRDNRVVLPKDPQTRMEILNEAKYFQINGLIELIESIEEQPEPRKIQDLVRISAFSSGIITLYRN